MNENTRCGNASKVSAKTVKIKLSRTAEKINTFVGFSLTALTIILSITLLIVGGTYRLDTNLPILRLIVCIILPTGVYCLFCKIMDKILMPPSIFWRYILEVTASRLHYCFLITPITAANIVSRLKAYIDVYIIKIEALNDRREEKNRKVKQRRLKKYKELRYRQFKVTKSGHPTPASLFPENYRE